MLVGNHDNESWELYLPTIMHFTFQGIRGKWVLDTKMIIFGKKSCIFMILYNSKINITKGWSGYIEMVDL